MVGNQCSLLLLWFFVLCVTELHMKPAKIWYWDGNAMQGGGEPTNILLVTYLARHKVRSLCIATSLGQFRIEWGK
jgi:hypothetical protein